MRPEGQVSVSWLRGRDSNPGPNGYEPFELPLLHPASHPRHIMQKGSSTCNLKCTQSSRIPHSDYNSFTPSIDLAFTSQFLSLKIQNLGFPRIPSSSVPHYCKPSLVLPCKETRTFRFQYPRLSRTTTTCSALLELTPLLSNTAVERVVSNTHSRLS